MSPNSRYKDEDDSQAARRLVGGLDTAVMYCLGQNGLRVLLALCDEAPGTFFHSWRVMKIMHKAMDLAPCHIAAILLHDCGKLMQPEVYAENARRDLGRPDPLLLMGHVDLGRMIAEMEGFDSTTLAAIMEHHGTQSVGTDKAYQGQIPQSLFTACLMMADTIEAMQASESLAPSKVMEIYSQREAEGQFALIDTQELSSALWSIFNSESLAA